MSWIVIPGMTPEQMQEFRSRGFRDTPWLERLTAWWLTPGPVVKGEDEMAPKTPLDLIAFVDSGIRGLQHLHAKSTRLPAFDPAKIENKPLLVFYSFPSGWQDEIYILGVFPREKMTDTLRICDLMQTRSYIVPGACIPWQGSRSKDCWFRFCFDLRDASSSSEVVISPETVEYRVRLMMKFWLHRRSREFMDTDANNLFLMLHEGVPESPSSFFDLKTDKGRQIEQTMYWLSTWTCAHRPFLWTRWAHFEKMLLKFRLDHYFCKEHHFVLFLNANEVLLRQTDNAILLEDPGDRERELYRLRHPTGPLPNVWISVPVLHAGKKITDSPLYDIDNGRVVITYKDFFDWVWTRMEIAGRKIALRVSSCEYELQDDSNAHILVSTVLPVAERDLQEEDRIDAEERMQRRKALSLQSSSEAPVLLLQQHPAGKNADFAAMLLLAKTRFPPCMARHVWRSLVHRKHPKHESRVSLVKFLLEAGYEIEETEAFMYRLYEADTTYVQTQHKGNWTKEKFEQVYKGQVKQLHSTVIVKKTISAYGCTTLTSEEKREKSHGCPFASTVQLEIRSFLGWAGAQDVEDIMRFKHPQLCCSRYYQDRHPDKNPFTIKHPNQFFRADGSSIKRAKIDL